MKTNSYGVALLIWLLFGGMSSALAMVHAVPAGGQKSVADNKKNNIKKKFSEVAPPAYQKSKIIPLTMPAVKQSR
ncbi:MAG: hypothetical protein ACYC3O_10310 [Burkholderiales bacterium]